MIVTSGNCKSKYFLFGINSYKCLLLNVYLCNFIKLALKHKTEQTVLNTFMAVIDRNYFPIAL